MTAKKTISLVLSLLIVITSLIVFSITVSAEDETNKTSAYTISSPLAGSIYNLGNKVDIKITPYTYGYIYCGGSLQYLPNYVRLEISKDNKLVKEAKAEYYSDMKTYKSSFTPTEAGTYSVTVFDCWKYTSNEIDPYTYELEPVETFRNKYTFKVVDAKTKQVNPIKVTAKTKTVKLKNLKKKAQKVKALTIKNAQSKVSVKITSAKNAIKKFLKFNSKGTLTIKKWKKAKIGTYKIKVKITAKGNANYNAKTITKTVKIRIK